MTREYYDREIPPVNSASKAKQDAYWLLRSQITSAITQNWDTIQRTCPAVREALWAFEYYLEANPNITFQVFRPEDLGVTHRAGERTCLR